MKGKRSRDGGSDLPANGVAKKVKTAGSGKSPAGTSLADMSMDDFLSGGFMSGPDASGSKKKRGTKRQDERSTAAQGKGAAKTKGSAEPLEKSKGTKGKTVTAKGKTASAANVRTGAKAKLRPAGDASGKPAPASRTPKPSAANHRVEADEHKAQLEALKEQDPEFYNYLLQTDKELLEFGEGSDDDDDDEEEELEAAMGADGEAEMDADAAADADLRGAAKASDTPSPLGTREILSQALVDKWCQDAKEHGSAAALKRLIKAYRIACHLGDEEEDLDATMRITSGAVFNKILIFMIKEVGGLFRKLMKLPAGHLTVDHVRKAARWRKLENDVKSFLGNSLHLLTEMTDEAMVVFMLRHLRPSVPFLICSERLQRKFLKQALQQFGGGATSVRVQAILFIRQMAVALPPPTLSLAMKGVYRTFVVNAKFMSPSNLPHINFMASCVVELFGLDSAATYEHAFSYIRQLAVLLRGALSMKTKDSFREVYCWQTISSLELWAKLLATHADKEELRPLVYLVAQLLIGTIRLVPTARYFPLRLRCIRALNKLSQAAGQFVPVAPLLLEMLQWKGLHTAVKAGGRPPSDTVPQLRAGKQLLASVGFQQALVQDVLLLLAEHLAQWATSPAFPEMSHLVLLQLRKMAKDSKVERFRTVAKGLMAAIQANAAYVTTARNKLECSPKDTATLASFLASEAEKQQAPMRKYAAVLAEKAARQRAMKGAEEVMIGKGEPAYDDESDADDEGLPNQDLLPGLQQKSAAKRAGASKGTARKSVDDERAIDKEGFPEEDDDEPEDQLQDFELSESESE